MRLCVEPVDVNQLLQEILEDFIGMAESSGISLEVSCSEAMPRVLLDRPRVRQVLSNLLSNAFKFTPSGGCVRLDALQQARKLTLEVSDTGRGIDPKLAERVFEPYWQADPQSRIGVGLGLHIAQQIVELHGGTIGVRQTPGGGATFAIEIPMPSEEAA